MRVSKGTVILLLVNAALLALVVRMARQPRMALLASATLPSTNLQMRVEKKPAPQTVVAPATNKFEWAQLESEDYLTYIERLRKIGCPEQTIRDIIIADIDKLLAPEMQAIEGPRAPLKYWQPEKKELQSATVMLANLAKKQELDFEKRRVVQDLLGVDLAAERSKQKGERDALAEKLTFLPVEKQTRVRMIIEKANQEEVRIREKSWLEDDQMSAEDRARLREIQREKEQQVAALLSKEELAQYHLWFSPAAYKVRESFFTMEPTEQEFLSIYELQQGFDAEWGHVDPAEVPASEKPKFEAAQAELDAKIQEQLGGERFAEWKQMRDPDFREMRITAAHFNLPPEIAGEVYGFKRLLSEQRSHVMANPSLGADERANLLRALAQETENAVVEALGPRAYKYYLRSGAGEWIWK